MIDSLLALPSHLRKRLESALQAGLLTPPYLAAAVRAEIGNVAEVDEVVDALCELDATGVSGPGCAALLRGVDHAASRRPTPDFVWSGPEVPGLHARDTRRVYEELLGSAKRSAWVATYAFFDGPRAFEVLARRMDETPALQVTLLLNVQRKTGDTTSADHLVARFADRFWKEEWPGTARPRVFYDPRSVNPDDAGVLHAKAIVIDDESVFVTSANLTGAALDHNIEIGLLVRDRTCGDGHHPFQDADRAVPAEAPAGLIGGPRRRDKALRSGSAGSVWLRVPGRRIRPPGVPGNGRPAGC